MIRHDAPSLIIQLFITQWRTVRRLHHAGFRVGDDAVEPTRLLIGGTRPERFVAGYGRAEVGFGPGGELGQWNFVFLFENKRGG